MVEDSPEEPTIKVKIRVEYFGGTVDEYEIEEEKAHSLFLHFWANKNVSSVSFIRTTEDA